MRSSALALTLLIAVSLLACNRLNSQATTASAIGSSGLVDAGVAGRDITWRWLADDGALQQSDGVGTLAFNASRMGSGLSATFPAARLRGTWLSLSVEVHGHGHGWVGPRFKLLGEHFKFTDPVIAYPVCRRIGEGWVTCTAYAFVPSGVTSVEAAVVGFSTDFELRHLRIAPVPNEELTASSDADVALFNEAVGLMKGRFFRARQVDWTAVIEGAKPWLKSPSGRGWASAAGWVAAQLPSDGHTSVSNIPTHSANAAWRDAPLNEVRKLDSNVGYVRLVGTPPIKEEFEKYASTTRAQIDALVDAGITRWVIDLRGNSGGSTYTMLAAIEPLVGVRTLGYAVGPNAEKSPWGLDEKGPYLAPASRGGVKTYFFNNDDALRAAKLHLRLIVLIDRHCASACEGMAIGLRSVPGTQLLGERTSGLATANAVYPLGTEFQLILTEANLADANGVIVYPYVAPDITLSGDPGRWIELAREKIAMQATVR